jgi:hypothetical protein
MTSEGSYELIAEGGRLRYHIAARLITPEMVQSPGRLVRLLLSRNRESDSVANSQALLRPKLIADGNDFQRVRLGKGLVQSQVLADVRDSEKLAVVEFASGITESERSSNLDNLGRCAGGVELVAETDCTVKNRVDFQNRVAPKVLEVEGGLRIGKRWQSQ